MPSKTSRLLAPLFQPLRRMMTQGTRATIDSVRTAPPPSPLAPIDLSDQATVHSVMDLAARLGDQLLGAGTGNSDTRAHLNAVMSAYGLHYTHADITLNTITVYAQVSGSVDPVTIFRVVRNLSTNFSRIVDVDQLIRAIVNGAMPLEEAHRVLGAIEAAPRPYRQRWALLAWGGFAATVAIVLGGGWIISLLAGITTVVTVFTNAWLAQRSLPPFFQNVLGGFTAVIPAAVVYSIADKLNLYLPPGLIIGSSIVALLAGLTLVQAIQDAITGAPVTASARFFETMVQTGAIISGIAGGIQAASWLGITLPPIDPSQTASSLGNVPVQILAGGLATAFFCAASFCDRRSMIVAALTALIAAASFFSITTGLGWSRMLANGVAALLTGLAGGLLSRRFHIPPQITAAAGITPLLPGLALYRGMSSLINDQFVVGLSNLAFALTTATMLASGVVLGEWVARRIRRPRISYRHKEIKRPDPQETHPRNAA